MDWESFNEKNASSQLWLFRQVLTDMVIDRVSGCSMLDRGPVDK